MRLHSGDSREPWKGQTSRLASADPGICAGKAWDLGLWEYRWPGLGPALPIPQAALTRGFFQPWLGLSGPPLETALTSPFPGGPASVRWESSPQAGLWDSPY